MTAISNNQIAEAINLFLRENDGNSVGKITNFLARKRLLSRSKDILSRLEKIIDIEHGIMRVKILTARKLPDSTKNDLLSFLKRRYGNKEFIFNEHFDETLLGGLRIEVGDEVVDLTLKSKMSKLQEHLTESI